MEPERTTRHESGLDFLQPSEHYRGLGTGFRHRCFGQLLSQPQFTTLDEMRGIANTLDSVTLGRVWYSGRTGQEQIEDVSHRATVSNRSGKVYAYVSSDYTPVNDADAFKPLMDVARENGLKPIGRFDGIGSGCTRGHVIFTNPEFRVRLLEDYNDDIMLGVRMTNSYDTQASVQMDVFGIRMVCSNYNLWGRMLGFIRQPHVNFSHENLERMTKSFLNDVIERSPILSELAQKALETEVINVDVQDLLWAIDLPLGGIKSVSSAPQKYNPDIDRMGLNMWTLYNSVTAYLTWGRDKGAHYFETSMDYAGKATELLNVDMDILLKKGKEAREKYEEHRRNRDVKKEKQTVKVVRHGTDSSD